MSRDRKGINRRKGEKRHVLSPQKTTGVGGEWEGETKKKELQLLGDFTGEKSNNRCSGTRCCSETGSIRESGSAPS